MWGLKRREGGVCIGGKDRGGYWGDIRQMASPVFAVSEKVLVPHVDRQYEAKVRENCGTG